MLCHELYFAIASVTNSESIQNVELHSVTVSGRILIRIFLCFSGWSGSSSHYDRRSGRAVFAAAGAARGRDRQPRLGRRRSRTSRQRLGGFLRTGTLFIHAFKRNILFHLCRSQAILYLVPLLGIREQRKRVH